MTREGADMTHEEVEKLAKECVAALEVESWKILAHRSRERAENAQAEVSRLTREREELRGALDGIRRACREFVERGCETEVPRPTTPEATP
jgi:hypothetical protein